MSIEALLFAVTTVSGLALFLALRSARAGGSAWMASWAALMASGMLIVAEHEWPAAAYFEHVVAPWFPALQLAGARELTSSAPPRWLVPATAGVSALRVLGFALGAAWLRYPVAFAFDLLVLGLAIATLLRRAPANRTWLARGIAAGIAAIAGLNAVDYARNVAGAGLSDPSWSLWIPIGLLVFSAEAAAAIDRSRQAARDRVEHARLEAARGISGGVAQGFSELLSVISGNAELARDDLAAGRRARAARSLERVAAAAWRGASVTRLLQDHSGGGPRKLEELDARPLCTGAVARVLESYASVRISVDFAACALALRGDRTQVAEAVEHVLANAAAQPAEGPVRMRVERIHNARDARGAAGTVARRGDYIEIAVSDRGAGMPPGVRERAFEPFFTTREHARGLGLSAAAGIVRSHGGLVRLDSAAGRGTTITLWFPAA